MNESSSIALDLLLNATSNPKTNLEQNIHEYVEGIDRIAVSDTLISEEDKKNLIKLLGITNMQQQSSIGIFNLVLSGPLMGAFLGTFVWLILYFIHKVQYVPTLIVTSAFTTFYSFSSHIMGTIWNCDLHLVDIYIETENKKLAAIPLVGKFLGNVFKQQESVIADKADGFALEKTRKNLKSIETESLDDFLNK